MVPLWQNLNKKQQIIWLNSHNINILLKKLNVIESERNYIASISPIFFVHATQGKDSYEFQYLLKLYNKNKITPFEIDFPSNPQEPIPTYENNTNNTESITFKIKSTDISSNEYYLSATALSNDAQIIDYELLSYKLVNKEDGGIKDDSPVITEKEKKKSKLWIALI